MTIVARRLCRSTHIPLTIALLLTMVISVAPLTSPRTAHALSMARTMLTLSPTSGPPGTLLRITGKGFCPTEPVLLLWNFATLATVTSTVSGTFVASILVPLNAVNGSYVVMALGQQSYRTSHAKFTVRGAPLTTRLVVDPASGGPGTGVNAYVYGFQANETANIAYGNTNVTACSTDSSGFCTATFTVSNSSPRGSYVVQATGSTSSATAAATFNQNRGTLVVTPMRITPGSVVTIDAYGFQPYEYVDIYKLSDDSYNGSPSYLTYCTTDGTGSCVVTYTWPYVGLGGGYYITARGFSSGVTTAQGANHIGIAPLLVITPTTGPPGTVITTSVYGYGCPAGLYCGGDVNVYIYYNSVYQTQCYTSQGTCAITFTVPSGSPPGAYIVESQDQNYCGYGCGYVLATATFQQVGP